MSNSLTVNSNLISRNRTNFKRNKIVVVMVVKLFNRITSLVIIDQNSNKKHSLIQGLRGLKVERNLLPINITSSPVMRRRTPMMRIILIMKSLFLHQMKKIKINQNLIIIIPPLEEVVLRNEQSNLTQKKILIMIMTINLLITMMKRSRRSGMISVISATRKVS